MTGLVPVPPLEPQDALDAAIKASSESQQVAKRVFDGLALAIGYSAVDHLKTMYPAALDAVTKNAQVSLRNHVRNDINAKIWPVILAALNAKDIE